MGELGRCPRERPGPEPEAARRERLLTGEVVAQSVAVGAGGDPSPAEVEAVRSVAKVELLSVTVDRDVVIMVDLGRARGYTRGEGNSQGGDECRTG